MATWSTKSALLGSSESDTSCLSSPSSPPVTPTTTTYTPPTTPSPTLDDCMDDSGFQDWMEMQLGVTGEMSVVERLQHLLDTGQFADITIRVGQGNNSGVFKAHRLLLATASQPLYRLLQQGTQGPNNNDMYTLRINDMKPADFESILKYIYTDQVECENISVAFGLLRASRKWGLAGLGIKSLTYLEEFVDSFEPTTDDAKDNLFDLLVLSEDTLVELSNKCWQIILKNAENLIPCRGYLNLDKPMVQKVLCHPELKIEDQLKLFEAIRDWGLHYLQEHNLPLSSLGSVVEEIIKVVDFEKITDADFLSTVLTSECLGKAEVIAFFMTHGLEIPRKLDFNNNKELPFWLTFCATSGHQKGTSKSGGRTSKRSSTSSSSSPSSLAPVSEGLSSICSLTQNGSVMEFNKVCRFKKGYRCLPKEIYTQHELRFRVDKNVKLLGVGFGFLFTPTDMGLNIHCQGPWETRQWTDIIQSYVRVSGEKQETADVRLMFLHPVRIEANQSYKVVVKMVRMSHGSNEVELWGGTGGVYSVETEDVEFSFIKAAVDPDKAVEESDGDTNPGVITALLYTLDTGEPDPTPAPIRRRRPVQAEEEAKSPTTVSSNPWRQRSRPDSLRIPETPYARKRSPTTDDTKSFEAPPPVRRRERPPAEEYKPTSFSTNRWRTRPKEQKEEKPASEEYLPSTFSTNRWARTRPKEDSAATTETKTETKKPTDDYLPSSFSTNRWARPRPKEDSTDTAKTQTERRTSAPEYQPSSFSTNRWAKPKEEKTEKAETQPERKTSAPEEYKPTSFSTNRWAKPKEEKTETQTERKTSASEEYKPTSFSSNRWRSRPKEEETTTDTSRKTSTEENRWRTRPQEVAKDTPFGMRVRSNSRTEESISSHPFARRRDSQDSKTDIPFYLRKTEEAKPPTGALGRSRWGGSSSTTTNAASSYSSTPSSTSNSTSDASSAKPAGETTFHSRFLRSSGSTSSPYTSSRFGSVRESSLTRSSLPRFTSGGSYLSRYDSTPDSSSSRAAASGSRSGGGEGPTSSPPATRKSLRYGTSATSSGSNLLALSNSSFGLGAGGGSGARASPRRDTSSFTGSKALDRYGGTSASTGRYGATTTPGSTSTSRYSSTTTPSRYGGTSGLGSTTSSRYGLSGTPSYGAKTSSGTAGTSGRYTARSATDTVGGTGRYALSGSSLGSRYGSGGKYGSPAPGDASSSRGSGMSGYSRASGGTGQGSRYGLSGSSGR